MGGIGARVRVRWCVGAAVVAVWAWGGVMAGCESSGENSRRTSVTKTTTETPTEKTTTTHTREKTETVTPK